MPTGLVEDPNGVGARKLGGDVVEMELHASALQTGRTRPDPVPRSGQTEQIGRLRALIMNGAGQRAGPRPAIGQLVLLADPHLILT